LRLIKRYAKISPRLFAGRAAAALALLIFGAAAARAQQAVKPEAPPAPASAPAQKPAAERAALRVKANKDAPGTFNIVAKDAKLTELAAELSRLIKAPVFLSPVMREQRVTVELAGANLESVLRMLAPHPYVDYEVSGDGGQPRPLGVYLHALNERPPSATEVVKGSNEAMLIEGNTEDGVGTEEEQQKRDEQNPLKVAYTQNQLSVRARQQPLSVIVAKIAAEIGVPFELRHMSNEGVDIDFKNYTLEQAVRALSPGVRLMYRSDLQTFQILPLRMVLAAPATAQTSN